MSGKKIWSLSSQIIIDEAIKNNYEYDFVDKGNEIFTILFPNKQKVLFKNIDCGLNSSLSLKLANNKALTYKMLGDSNYIAKSKYFNLEKNRNIEINSLDLKLPLVVKPIDESHGNGVSTGILNQKSLNLGINEASKFSNNLVIQEFQEGIETRILIIDGECIGAINRQAAFIIGNGVKSLEELIKDENDNPLRGEQLYTKPMNKITIDIELKEFIIKQGYKLQDVLEKDKKIILRGISNMGAGGISIDVTNQISNDIKELAIYGAKKLGLVVAGVDIISNNFNENLGGNNSAIILEINASPAIDLHHFPIIGNPQNAAEKILKLAKEKAYLQE